MARVSTAALLLVAACQAPTEQPDDALEAFLTDLEYGRAEPALERIDHATRTALRQRWDALEQARHPDRPPTAPTPRDLLYGVQDLRLLQAPESVAVVSPPGDRVTLRVWVEGGRRTELQMVREDERWKVDLRGALTSTASASGSGSGGD